MNARAQLMGDPSRTLASATQGPAAHDNVLPSYVQTPPTTLSFSFTASQNLDLHYFG